VGNDARLRGPDVVAGSAVDPGRGTPGVLVVVGDGAGEDAVTDGVEGELLGASSELQPPTASRAAATVTAVVVRAPHLTGSG
jgi:hypothetical protein